MDLSIAALRSGIERDCPGLLDSFDAVKKRTAWYGDLNAEILQACGKHYDEKLDIGDRENVLTTLRDIKARKRFGIRQYDHLPGKSAIPEAVVGVAAPVAGAIGLSGPLIKSVMKDFARYFDRKSDYAMKVRERLRDQLCSLLDSGDRIVLLSHGTGSVVAYDVLWQLSHDPEFKDQYGDKKVELWMTLGAPLGDTNIRKRLLGAKEKAAAKFPLNVIAWYNVAAEDDYICHDNTMADWMTTESSISPFATENQIHTVRSAITSTHGYRKYWLTGYRRTWRIQHLNTTFDKCLVYAFF